MDSTHTDSPIIFLKTVIVTPVVTFMKPQLTFASPVLHTKLPTKLCLILLQTSGWMSQIQIHYVMLHGTNYLHVATPYVHYKHKQVQLANIVKTFTMSIPVTFSPYNYFLYSIYLVYIIKHSVPLKSFTFMILIYL